MLSVMSKKVIMAPTYCPASSKNGMVEDEIQDLCEGHPGETGTYHYHHLTNCFTDSTSGHSGQVGWALDGYVIYGPKGTSGSTITNAQVDE